jgi:hypothetical protein
MWAKSRPVIPAVLVTDPEGRPVLVTDPEGRPVLVTDPEERPVLVTVPEGRGHALSIVPGRAQLDNDSSAREFNSAGCAAEVCIESWGEQSAEAETERWRELSVSDRVEVANICRPELNFSSRAEVKVDRWLGLAFLESEQGHLSDFSTFGRRTEARNGRCWQGMSAVSRVQKKNGGRWVHGSGSDAESGPCRQLESRFLGRAKEAENDRPTDISEKLWRLEETSTVQPTRFRHFDSEDSSYFLSQTIFTYR